MSFDVTASSLYAQITTTIAREKETFNEIGRQIWLHPELLFEEKFAHQLLTNALEKYGFSVQRNYFLPTAFRAEFSGKGGNKPVIAILCEYDALPDIGHACGHNLIAESGIVAAVGIKEAMEFDNTLSGKIVVLGTPAEEGGGGKIDMIEAGAFKDIDICMMVHPSPMNLIFPPFIAITRVTAKFCGKAAHASAFPWEGLNALDAAVICYNSVSMLRQQTKPTCRMHCIISKGGVVPNIIPSESEMIFYLRAPTNPELAEMRVKLVACIEAAATASGCKVILTRADRDYKGLMSNHVIGRTFRRHGESLGLKFQDDHPNLIKFVASSDVGDVSHEVPTIQPSYYIGTQAPNHSKDFATASGAPEAQPATLVMGRIMAMTAIDFMLDPKLVDEAKEQFNKDKENEKIKT